MSDENQNTENTEVVQTTEEASAQEATTETPNEYAVKLEQELARKETELKKAQHTIVDTKRKLKELKETPEEDEDEPVVNQSVPSAADITAQVQAEMQNQRILDQREIFVTEMSSDPKEQELMRYYLDERINIVDGSIAGIREAVETAKLLANKDKIYQTQEELKRSVNSYQSRERSSANTATVSGGVDVSVALSSKDQTLLERRGLTAKDVQQNMKNRGEL